MNPLTTLEPPAHPSLDRTILAQDGFTGTLLTLAPGDEIAPSKASAAESHLLFVVDGEVTVRSGEINTMLKKEDAMLLARNQPYGLRVHASNWAKVLRIAIPGRDSGEPLLHTVQS